MDGQESHRSSCATRRGLPTIDSTSYRVCASVCSSLFIFRWRCQYLPSWSCPRWLCLSCLDCTRNCQFLSPASMETRMTEALPCSSPQMRYPLGLLQLTIMYSFICNKILRTKSLPQSPLSKRFLGKKLLFKQKSPHTRPSFRQLPVRNICKSLRASKELSDNNPRRGIRQGKSDLSMKCFSITKCHTG